MQAIAHFLDEPLPLRRPGVIRLGDVREDAHDGLQRPELYGVHLLLGLAHDLVEQFEDGSEVTPLEKLFLVIDFGMEGAQEVQDRVPHRIAEQEALSGTPSLVTHWAIDEPFCWFVPEVEDDPYPVYQTTVPIVEKILSQCSFFEYYLLNKPLDLLLIENDHNQIIVAQYIAN
jgi:hypothetical protein